MKHISSKTIKTLKSRPAYWLKLAMICILLLIIQLVAYLVVVQGYNTTLEQEYKRSLDFNHDNYNNAINSKFSNIYDNFETYYASEDKDVTYYGLLNATQGLTVYVNGSPRHYALNSSDYNNLAQNKLSFNTLFYLSRTDIIDQQNLAIVSKLCNDEITRLLFFSYEQFLTSDSSFGFNNFSVINSRREQVLGNYDQKDVFEGKILESDLSKEGISNIFESVNNVDGIISIENLKFSDDYYLVGFIANETIVAAVKKVSTVTVLMLTLSLFACMALTVVAGIIYTLKQDYIYGYNINTKDFYVVYTDNFGNIKKSNREFKLKYDCKNLFETENLDLNFHQLSNNDNYIIKLKNNDNQYDILNFLSTKTKKGFKFVGVNGANVTEYYIKEVETPYIDTATSLYNKLKFVEDYNSYKGSGRRIVGIVKLANITTFGTLFGREFFGKVRQIYAAKINELFNDIAKVYIAGSDSFYIYVDKEENVESLLRDVGAEMEKLNQASQVGENVVKINTQAGFVIVDDMIDNQLQNIENCCDATLKRALKNQDVNFYVYHESQKQYYEKFFKKEYDIDDMLSKNLFELYFQPQVALQTGKIVGFEALLRIKKSHNINVEIFDLICYAEQTGQMVKLGQFVFDEGMKFASTLKEENIVISLNVSPVQLMQAGFTDDFIKIFNKYGLSKDSIALEVTESFMMNDVETSILKFKLLNSHGINVHLDDFGIGYSSLTYLKKLPVTVIKIDREFVKDIDKNEYSQTITKMIIGICKSLNLHCIAEGVENQEQAKLLKEYGCDMVQGYYIGKPASQEDIKLLLYKYNHKNQSEND